MNGGRLVILGGRGDLTRRYLLPALAELTATGRLGDVVVVGVARERLSDQQFQLYAFRQLETYAGHLPPSAREDFVSRLRYVAGDATEPATLRTAVGKGTAPVVVYLALPPTVFGSAIAGLITAGLEAEVRVVVEKPFGTDLNSARRLNALLHRHFAESAVFRVDHFLGKQTVQNILGLRFANRFFEPLWCARHIERVDIIWDETVALDGRAAYYDQTGALRDIVQNHLLQLLCLIAMERPAGLGAQPLRDAKVQVLKSVRRLDFDDVDRQTTRARYCAGSVAGKIVPDYAAEPGVNPAAGTETFVETTLFVENERWRTVPFRLRTGKALACDRQEVRIRFRPMDRLPFGQPFDPGPNVLTVTMNPDRLAGDFALNGAGDPFCLEPARWELELAPQELSPYARLLIDILNGDPSLCIRADEAEECWSIIEPIVAAWEAGATPLDRYVAGSEGPGRT